MSSELEFAGQVCLVTGGATGIGRATAWRFASLGAKVAVLDINAAELATTREGVEARGSVALGIVSDVSQPMDVRAAVARVEVELGPIGVLVSNAGIAVVGEIHDLSLEQWDQAFLVNTRSTFVVVQEVLLRMRERGFGAISITASTAATVGEVGSAPYAPSKAALVNFTKQVAAENAHLGIRCNCVCPGWIDTPFNDPSFSTDEERVDTIRRQVPMGREGMPEEVASVITFVCSSQASYMTGHTLMVDGGLTLGPR